MGTTGERKAGEVGAGSEAEACTRYYERKSKDHEVKIWADYFEAVRQGRKKHEIRVNDRDYRVGDTLHLFEYDNLGSHFTGRTLRVRVTHITHGGQWGIEKGVVVMSIEPA